jgi:hypothetical protein
VSELKLTRIEYNQIRIARDQHARATTTIKKNVCPGCGCERDHQTRGCKACWERKYRQKRRRDPVLNADDQRRWRVQKQSERNRAKHAA